jgi:endonuclease-3 related protein
MTALVDIYDRLNAFFGDLHWWPGDSALEMIVGAILTQNTAWRNVERTLHILKGEGLLSIGALYRIQEEVLAESLRPAGYYRIKAKRLKALIAFLQEIYMGSLECMFTEDLSTLRNKLLAVKGVGEETADSILLYAGKKPIFVVDAYTRRILARHEIIHNRASYSGIQTLFMDQLPEDVSLFNQYHALLVNAGKQFCRKVPNCTDCPLSPLLEKFP